MPVNLDQMIQRMIDAGEPEEAIAAVIQSFPKQAPMSPVGASEPDTFASGVMKSLTSGEAPMAGLEGLGGFARGAIADIPNSMWGGIKGIGSLLTTDPRESLPAIGNAIADAPGQMVKSFRESGSNPHDFGRMLGQATGQPVVGMGLSKVLPSVGQLTRGSGRALEGIGDVMRKSTPLSGFVPHAFGITTPKVLARGAERAVGRGLSSVGSSLRNLGTPRTKGTAEVVPEMQSPWNEGEILPGLPPSRQLGPSPISEYSPLAADVPPIGKMLTGNTHGMEAPSPIVGTMNSPVDDSWAQQVLGASDTPAPYENIFNAPETTVPPMKMLDAAPTAETQLMELVKQMESQGGMSAGQKFGPVDDVLQANPTGAGASDEMYDIIQKMSGGRIPPKATQTTGLDIDNEINSLIEQLGKTRQPDIPINNPSIGMNASGESAASMEAMNRMTSMAKKGESFVVYDKGGNVKPLIGPEAVDYVTKPGETYGVRGPNGFKVLDDMGGKVPSSAKLPVKDAPKTETYTVPAHKATKQLVEGAQKRGFRFVEVDKKTGDFRFARDGKKKSN